MLFYLFSFLLYICILLLILPIGNSESVAKGGDGKPGKKTCRFFACSSTVILLFQYFSWAKSLFSFQPLYFPRFPRCCHCGCLLRTFDFVFVSFVTTVSINHHKPHAFELVVVIVAGGGVAVQRNCFATVVLCCAVPCVFLCVCVCGNKFAVALGYVFNL